MRVQCKRIKNKTILTFDDGDKYVAFEITNVMGSELPDMFKRAVEQLNETV